MQGEGLIKERSMQDRQIPELTEAYRLSGRVISLLCGFTERIDSVVFQGISVH
jgi:hypothetical protein